MLLKFKGKPWKQGDSVVLTIPSDFVKNGQVVVGKEQQFAVEIDDGAGREVDDDGERKTSNS